MRDSHIAGKKYWIISRVVEVITSQSNEIYHEWPKATSDESIIPIFFQEWYNVSLSHYD